MNKAMLRSSRTFMFPSTCRLGRPSIGLRADRNRCPSTSEAQVSPGHFGVTLALGPTGSYFRMRSLLARSRRLANERYADRYAALRYEAPQITPRLTTQTAACRSSQSTGPAGANLQRE